MAHLETRIGANSPVIHQGVMDVFAPSLSPEQVTRGEVETLCSIADNLLVLDGEDSTVNGIPARVTREYFDTEIAGKRYYARVYRFNGNSNFSDQPQPAIIFDETPEITAVSKNHLAVRFKEFGGGISLVVDNDELDPELDRPEHVNAVQSVLNGLNEKVQNKQIEIKKEKETEAYRKSLARKKKAAKIGRVALKTSGYIAAGAAFVGVVWGVIYGISKIDLPDSVPFDQKDFALEGGSVISLGDTANPEFSSQLLSEEGNAPHGIPVLGEDPTGNSEPEILESNDTFREIIIDSSEDDRDCQTVGSDLNDGQDVIAWTDFTDDNGVSRADELVVTNERGSITVCWTGEETDDFDDPRVVVAPGEIPQR